MEKEWGVHKCSPTESCYYRILVIHFHRSTSEYISLTHILLRSPKDISCSCRFSPLFQVVFLLIFYILIPEDFDLRIKKMDFFQSWVRFFSYFNISHSLRWIDPIQVCWTTLPYHAETHLTVTSPYNLAWTAFKFRNIEII